MDNTEIKHVRLPNGNTLEVTIYPGFLEKVREHFSLEPSSQINDDHIRMYIYSAFKSAIDKQSYGTI